MFLLSCRPGYGLRPDTGLRTLVRFLDLQGVGTTVHVYICIENLLFLSLLDDSTKEVGSCPFTLYPIQHIRKPKETFLFWRYLIPGFIYHSQDNYESCFYGCCGVVVRCPDVVQDILYGETESLLLCV